MKTSATNRRVRVLLSSLQDETLIPRPEFQRRLVWSKKDKFNFVSTVLEEYPFPEVYVAAGDVNLETGQGTEMLVDGQQRLTTLNQYFRGSPEFATGGSIKPYKDLPDDEKKRFLDYEVVVRDLGNLGIDEIKKVFLRLNSTGYSLNAMEMQNARYNGEFKQFAESIASNKFFEARPVFSANDIRRMEDVRFVLTFIVTIMSTYFHRVRELESYLKEYNDDFPEKQTLKNQILRVFEFIESCELENSSRAWQRADIFTLLVECYRSLEKDALTLDANSVAPRLKAFYKSVDEFDSSTGGDDKAARYYRAAVLASNDRSRRIERGNALAAILRNIE